MGQITNSNPNVFNVTPNIVIEIDDDGIGELRIYDEQYAYPLNGCSASDLIYYFDVTNRMYLSEEILDLLMSMNTNERTN